MSNLRYHCPNTQFVFKYWLYLWPPFLSLWRACYSRAWESQTFRIEKKTCRIEGNFNDYQTIGDVYDFDSKSLLKVEWLWSSLNGEQ